MRELQRKIKRVQSKLRRDNSTIRRSRSHILRFVQTPAGMASVIIGGFTLGYVLARNKSPSKVLHLLGKLAKIGMHLPVM